jgi:hypothetical protein
MNADHVDPMILLAHSKARLEATEATMTAVDFPRTRRTEGSSSPATTPNWKLRLNSV